MKKRILVVLLSLIMLIGIIPGVSASTSAVNPTTGARVVSPNVLSKIEALLAEVSSLQLRLYDLDDSDIYTRQVIEEEINAKQQKAYKLGLEDVSSEFLEELIISQMEALSENQSAGAMPFASWHPSDMIATLQTAYNVNGVTIVYNGKTQYHLIITARGSDPYLHKVTTNHVVYNVIKSGSVEASMFINDTMRIYAEKLIGTGLDLLNPMLSLIPYELFTSYKPAPTSVSSNGSALVSTLNTVTEQRFVYIYDSVTDDWLFCLSTNRASFSVSFLEAILFNGVPINNPYASYGPLNINGDYYSATTDADATFKKGLRNTCIYKIAIYSKSLDRDVVNHTIHAPMDVSGML